MESFQVWHEINNSLTAVNLTLEFLQKSSEEISSSDLQNELSFSLESLAHIREIIQSANGSREQGREAEFFDVSVAIEHALAVLQRKWPKSSLTFTNKVANCELYGHKTALIQVFMNLITNALESYRNEEYRAKLGVKIRFKKRGDGLVEILVKDWGEGVPVEAQSRIFENGFSLKKTRGGSGIGLALCKQIVEEEFGGRISCKSRVGEGSEFVVSLPIELVPTSSF